MHVNTGFVLWLSIFVLAVLVHPAQSSLVKAPSSSFWDTDMRLCDIDENGDCNNSEYAKSIVRFGIGGVVAAFLSLVFFLLFIPIRFLCNGFGGRNPSTGICPSLNDSRHYTRSEILSVKVLSVLVLIPIIIAIGIGFQANSDISNSLESVTGSIVESGDNIRDSLVSARDVILFISNSSDARSIVDDAIKTATDVTENLHNVDDNTNKYDGVRESLMIAGAVCCVALVVGGIVCALLNLRAIAMVLGLVSLIILTIIWLSFGAHLVAGKFDYDVCVDIDLLTTENSMDSNSVFKTGALASLWKCDNNTELINLQNLVNSSIDDAASNACDARAQICYNPQTGNGDPNWTCTQTPACSRDTLSIVTNGTNMRVTDGGTSKNLTQCAVDCTSAAYRNTSLAILNSVAMFNNYTSIYYNQVLPIISCQIAVDVLNQVKHPLCRTMADGLYGVAVSNLVVGIFYIPFIVAMIMGFKRFRSMNDAV